MARVGLGQAKAMIVGAAKNGGLQGMPGEGAAAGLEGVEDGAIAVVDKLTGGAVSDAAAKADDIQFWLKVSIGCSIAAAAVTVFSALRRELA